MPNFSDFEKVIKYSFKDKALLREAFTHRSYLNENRNFRGAHNERMEFLGDAVLELSVTDFLYRKYPDKDEGELTSYRAALVNAVILSSLARELSMNDFLLLSKGEAKDTGRARTIILANVFEAVVGAIYLDSGYDSADEFIKATLFPLLDDVVKRRLWQDAKSYFQEKSQEEFSKTPTYEIVRETGPDHDKQFVVGVYIGNDLVAQGTGKSKQEAQQSAAEEALTKKGWR